MEDRFHLIAVTDPIMSEDEPDKIIAVLKAGFWRVHLRHPGIDSGTVSRILDSIPESMHERITLHYFPELAMVYGTGLQLNSRISMLPHGWRPCKLSRSCHSLDEVRSSSTCDYVTLSPVFDSISKPGYKGMYGFKGFTGDSFGGQCVIAMGGVTPVRFMDLKCHGFSGAAMLGAMGWERPISIFKEHIKNMVCYNS